jgi:ABC-type nickel/cobalt efflux system permease component RcnA
MAVDTIIPTAGVLGFGFLLGLKHAMEADHLAAVSTIVSERRSLWSGALVGAMWGLGHTASLVAAGVLALVLHYRIGEGVERWLEFAVGVMLVLIGANVLRKLLTGGRVHLHIHQHGGHEHAHVHMHDPHKPDIHHGRRFRPRPLLVGMVHGLAGSAALMLMMIPTIESPSLGLLYVLVFGVGSIGGMMLMSFVVGLPFHFTALRFTRMNWLLQGGAGSLSIILGLWIAVEKAAG